MRGIWAELRARNKHGQHGLPSSGLRCRLSIEAARKNNTPPPRRDGRIWCLGTVLRHAITEKGACCARPDYSAVPATPVGCQSGASNMHADLVPNSVP